MPEPSSLTVFCKGGLCNRLRVLVSGIVLAETAGRHFCMLWPETPYSNAPFHSLFENDWNVVDVKAEVLADLQEIKSWIDPFPDPLSSQDPHLVIGFFSWLLRPDLYPEHSRLLTRCSEVFAKLTPSPYVQTQVAQFKEDHFQNQMIGVHLRRGDYLYFRPDVTGNTELAMQAVDLLVNEHPDTGILLCTDDGAADPLGRYIPTTGVREQFQKRYGDRLVLRPARSLNRETPEAIQDALIDLWLLRATDFFVGTSGSSYSKLAIYGRDIPQVITSAEIPVYHRLEQITRWSGISKIGNRFGVRRYGRILPFIFWARDFASKGLQIAGRLLKRIAPII